MQGALHVRLSFLAATIVATLAGFFSFASSAQAQARAGHNIAVVDVSVIFKKHARFLAMTEQFKKEVAAAETRLKDEYNEIKSLQTQLAGLQAGSPDYKQMEQRLAKQMADWQLKGQMQKKDFMEAEGRIYFQVYRELDDAVKRFAQKHTIALVLRYASDPVDDPNDRGEIVRGINKSVVYVDPTLDITEHILSDLNRSGAAVSWVPGTAAPGVQRPVQR
jgi:Skp family chaperone for outer membrane proteins